MSTSIVFLHALALRFPPAVLPTVFPSRPSLPCLLSQASLTRQACWYGGGFWSCQALSTCSNPAALMSCLSINFLIFLSLNAGCCFVLSTPLRPLSFCGAFGNLLSLQLRARALRDRDFLLGFSLARKWGSTF